MSSRVISTTRIVGLGTTPQKIDVDMGTPFANFIGYISKIDVHGSSNSGASTLTIAMSKDEDGDKQILTVQIDLKRGEAQVVTTTYFDTKDVYVRNYRNCK